MLVLCMQNLTVLQMYINEYALHVNVMLRYDLELLTMIHGTDGDGDGHGRENRMLRQSFQPCLRKRNRGFLVSRS